MKRILSLLVLALPVALDAATVSPVTPAQKQAAGEITEALIRAHIKFLASDLLEGRGPATRGDRLAEEYIATELEALGLKPGAPGGGWFQRVPLVAMTPNVPPTMTFVHGEKRLELKFRDEFMAFSGVQKPETRIEDAEVVFVGYGIVAPEYRWDDYKDVDVRGKVLLMMNNDPEDDPNLFAGKTRLWYGRWDYKYQIAAKKGAVGAIIIHTHHSAGYPWQVVQTSWSGEQFELPDEGGPRVQIKVWATEDASRRIAALGGQDLDRLRASAERRDFRPVPLGARLSFSFTNDLRQEESANVLGELPGSDPKLAGEVVIYTAHHDHFGIKRGARPGLPGVASARADDVIFNGALDNASGVAAILSIASAFADLPTPPRRTVLFALVAAEEQGLLGSEYLARHPPVAPGRIAADINVDVINWFGRTRDLSVIGLGKSNLDETVEALAKMQGRIVKPDQFPDRGVFYRSDQFSFAKIGVPAAYLKAGTDVIGKPEGWGREQIEKYEKTDYHQPSDEYRDSWDLSGAVEDAQLCFLLGVRVADADAMPRWNKGDEFEAARKKALSDIGVH